MIANHKGEIPFVVLFIPFLLGLLTGLNFLSYTWIPALIIAFSISSVIFIALNLFYKSLQLYKLKWVGGVLMHLILFFAGCIIILNCNELTRKDHFCRYKAKYLAIKVDNEPVSKNGFIRFKATVIQAIDSTWRKDVNGNLLINIKDSLAKTVQYGDEVLIPANYKPVDPPFNPAEFNYKQYLAGQNIHYQSFLFPKQYAIIEHNTGNRLIAYALNLRRQLAAKLKAAMHDAQATAVASTILLGYRADLSSDVLQAYSQTGTVYVLTVSGAQIAVIYFLLNWLLSFLKHRRYGKLLRAVIIIAILWYYALLTGFSVSVCRAVLMVSLVVTGRTFSRYINSINLLAISAFVLLLYNPLFITDVGFQFAYLAVSGLIILRPTIYNWLKLKNRIADKLWELCSVSIAAQLITFPLSAFYFHQFPVYFLLSNLLVFVPAAIIMYLGMIYLLLPHIPYISKALAYVIEQTTLVMNKVLSVMQHLPFASINKIWIDRLEYLFIYLIIISAFAFLYYKKSWLLQSALVYLLLFCGSISYQKVKIMQSNNLAFLNLRKHTGIMMRNGKQAAVITDLPDTDKNYRYSIQPYLDSCGIEQANIYHPVENFAMAFADKRINYIQFLNKRILLFDKHINNITTPEKLDADYIYLSGNPYPVLQSLDKNFNCRMLVIDAGNSNQFVNEAQKQAILQHVSFTILKRNNSLVAVSNE